MKVLMDTFIIIPSSETNFERLELELERCLWFDIGYDDDGDDDDDGSPGPGRSCRQDTSGSARTNSRING